MSIASPNVPQTSGSVAASQNGPHEAEANATPAQGPTATRAVDHAHDAPREGIVQRTASAMLGRPAFWLLFLLLAFVWPMARAVQKALPPKLPVLGTIQPFELVDQTGRPVGSKELEGRVWVVSAVRTSSPVADDLTKQLSKIQHRARNLGPAFHIVTVGVDPEGDTPEHLAEFTTHYRVSPRIWSFLSGESSALRAAQSALGLAVSGSGNDGDPGASPRKGRASASEPPRGPLSVVLVDGKMRVRGRYDLAEPDAIDTLLYHTGLLVNRGD